MEGLFRLVCEIALIAGVVAQRILTALATSIATGVFQLIDNVVGGAGHKFASVGQNVREGLSHALDYVVQGASALLRVFTYLWMFTAGVAKFFWTSLLDTVHMIANGIFNMISGMWTTLFTALVSLSDKILESAVLINLGAFQLVQSCVSDVCITIRRVSDGYFSYHSLEAPSPTLFHPAAGIPGAITCLSGGPSVASLSSSEESVSPGYRPPRHTRRAYTPTSYADAVALGMSVSGAGIEGEFIADHPYQQQQQRAGGNAPVLRKRSQSHSPSFPHRAHMGCDDFCCADESEGESGAHFGTTSHGETRDVVVVAPTARRRVSGERDMRSGSRSPADSAQPSRAHTPHHTTDEEDARESGNVRGAKHTTSTANNRSLANTVAVTSTITSNNAGSHHDHKNSGANQKQQQQQQSRSQASTPALATLDAEGRFTPRQTLAAPGAQATESHGERQREASDGFRDELAHQSEAQTSRQHKGTSPLTQATPIQLTSLQQTDGETVCADAGAKSARGTPSATEEEEKVDRAEKEKEDKIGGARDSDIFEGMEEALMEKVQTASVKKPLFMLRHLEQLQAERPDRKRSVSVG